MRPENTKIPAAGFWQKLMQSPLMIQMKELVGDIAGTVLLALRQRRPTAKYCPILIVRILSIIPGLGHIYAGFRIRGLFWLLITIPIIAAFIFVVMDVGFINPRTVQAIIGMYIVLVFFCIRDASHVVGDACSTQRFIDYFEREKAVSRKYKEFIDRQYNLQPEDEKLEDIVPQRPISQNDKK